MEKAADKTLWIRQTTDLSRGFSVQQITLKQGQQQVSLQPPPGQVDAGGQGRERGCLVQFMPALCEQQNPEAQATWLQALVGLEE